MEDKTVYGSIFPYYQEDKMEDKTVYGSIFPYYNKKKTIRKIYILYISHIKYI